MSPEESTAGMLARQQEIIAECLEHNFWTWSAQGGVKPLPVARAEGAHFWDFEGTRYLDFNSGVMCVNIGYGDRRVIAAIANQAEELIFAGPHTATKVRAELGKRLAALTPAGLDSFLYTLGGAEANENAIKLARAYTGRHKVLAQYRAYHGATHGAIAATGDPRRWMWEPNLMPGVVHFEGPFSDPWSHGSYPLGSKTALERLESVIRFEGPETIAAVLIETIPGTNGVLIPPEGYLEGIRELCTRHGIQLICDEVMTGFGRTGAWFAVEHAGVVPDLITMAKGLTSGYAPLGAVAIAPHIVDYFEERVFQGGLTYNGHPLGLAAAIANIDILKSDHLIDRSNEMGEVLAEGLKRLAGQHAIIADVRSIGLMAAVDLVRDPETREPLADYAERSAVLSAFREDCLKRRLYLRTFMSSVLIMPPLVIDEQDILAGLDILGDSIRELEMHISSTH
jgi:taurine--2-oxoglutarate transaminase